MSGCRVSVFIRTYHGDFRRLRYCLRSIRRDLSGRDEVVVCVPRGQSPSAGQAMLIRLFGLVRARNA
jgi:hypothetical protein